MNALTPMAFSLLASCVLATADIAADSTPEGLVIRYGVWGIVAALLGGCLWALKRLVNNVLDSQAARLEADRQLAALLGRWCQMLNERPCLKGHAALSNPATKP